MVRVIQGRRGPAALYVVLQHLLYLYAVILLVIQYFQHEVPCCLAVEGLTEVAEGGSGLTAYVDDVGRLGEESVIACFDIPKNNLREGVAVHRKLSLHCIEEGPLVAGTHILVDFHVGDNDECLGHFLGGDAVANRVVEDFIEGLCEVGGVANIGAHHRMNRIVERAVVAEMDEVGLVGEGHIEVLVVAGVVLCEVSSEAH